MRIDSSPKGAILKYWPFHDVGQSITGIAYFATVVLICIDNWILCIYLIAFSLTGACLSNMLFGLTPTQAVLSEAELASVRALLKAEPRIVEMNPDCWAPRRYKSWLWRSSHIKITRDGNSYKISARERDIRIISKKLED